MATPFVNRINKTEAQISAVRAQADRRLTALTSERTSWMTTWRECSKYILPRRGRFLRSANQNDKGRELNNSILDETGTLAARVFGAGMMSGVTSPSRPWFRFNVPNGAEKQAGPIKEWCEAVRDKIRAVLAKSNFYNAMGVVYEELGVFGTGVMVIEEDFEDGVRCYALTVGEYLLANNRRLVCDVLYREFQMTVEQIVNRWGTENCSDNVKTLHSTGQLDTEIDIVHAIEPNDDRVLDSALKEDKPYRSIFFEKGRDRNKMLAYEGFDDFPAIAMRWSQVGNDAYGRGPGMDALPPLRGLMQYARRKAELVDKLSKPPMKAPAALKNEQMSGVPGGVTFITGAERDSVRFEPAIVIQPQGITAVGVEQQDLRASVKRCFYEDLFLMLSQMDGVQPRQNLEVIERREEKMLMLGPALERIHDEGLDKALQRVFKILMRKRLLPEPPRELLEMLANSGSDLGIEYISILAQAQKSVGLTAIERVLGLAGNLAAVKPTVMDKVDDEVSLERYADLLGAPVDMLLSDEEMEKVRAARQQQAQQKQAMEAAPLAVDAAKVLASTETGAGQNALARMTGM